MNCYLFQRDQRCNFVLQPTILQTSCVYKLQYVFKNTQLTRAPSVNNLCIDIDGHLTADHSHKCSTNSSSADKNRTMSANIFLSHLLLLKVILEKYMD